jgi:hypothetical protein
MWHIVARNKELTAEIRGRLIQDLWYSVRIVYRTRVAHRYGQCLC